MNDRTRDLFDGQVSEARKQDGMRIAEENRSTELDIARAVARTLAAGGAAITADDVGRVVYREHGITSLGPAGGSLFKGKGWVWTGEWRKSERKTNHSRMLRVWVWQP